MAKKKGILERLQDGPVLGDGGYFLELEKRGWVRAGPFTPEVALLHPEALRELHVEFREAGADVLQALTFYASRDKLATVGLENSSKNSTARPCASLVKLRGISVWSPAISALPGCTNLTVRQPPTASAKPSTSNSRPGGRGRGLHHRRNFLLAGRGPDRGRAGKENRPAGDGHHLL